MKRTIEGIVRGVMIFLNVNAVILTPSVDPLRVPEF